jgi:hypothetical protein
MNKQTKRYAKRYNQLRNSTMNGRLSEYENVVRARHRSKGSGYTDKY